MPEARKNDPAPILTLKNLYRMMTGKDVLAPSFPVWNNQTVQGMTLNRFWKDYFMQVLSPETDFSLFEEPSLRRTLTRLMNRSGGPGLMKTWFLSVTAQLSPSLLKSMTELWLSLLKQHRSDQGSLSIRMEVLCRLILLQEDLENPEAERFLSGLILQPDTDSDIPLLFRHACALSWLTLYALFGSRSNDSALSALQMHQDSTCTAIYHMILSRPFSDNSITVLSGNKHFFSSPPSEETFIGREDCLKTALKTFESGCGKLAICGMGGIGKTSFALQLIQRMLSIKLFDRIAYVRYHQDLNTSFLSAFPSLGSEGSIRSAQRMLEEPKDRKTLLFLDQADSAENSDLQALSSFNCDILLTTRNSLTRWMDSLTLSGLAPAESEALFLLHNPQAREEPEEVRKLCALVEGHPLSILLFAKVCRIRFWSVHRLYDQLTDHGLSGIRYVNEGSIVHVSEVFSRLYHLAQLSQSQTDLLKIFSLLPFKYRFPEEISLFAADISTDREELADLCQILCNLGFLMRNESGYAIHPLIAETVRVTPILPDQFPRLWEKLSGDVRDVHPSGCQALITVFLRMGKPNLTAIRCLASLERSIGSFPFLKISDNVYEKHRQFLDTQPHEDTDVQDWALACGMRDILEWSRIDRLGSFIQSILAFPVSLLSSSRRAGLYTLLEYASAGTEKELVREAFRMLCPSKIDSLQMAEHLISLSVMQRRADHDPAAALHSLRRAREILMNNSAESDPGILRMFSDLYYRAGVCQLDLNEFSAAHVNLNHCLQILQELHIPEDSAKVMSTRSTYAVSLWLGKEYEKAFRQYAILTEAYQAQKREESLEYVMMRNNTALLLADLGRTEEAEKVVLEVLTLDSRLMLAQDIIATHHRNAAFILSQTKKWSAAEDSALKAVRLRREFFGADSPWTADAEAVCALVFSGMGRSDQAEAMILPACDLLLKSWGPNHRHTQNALRIQSLILKRQDH